MRERVSEQIEGQRSEWVTKEESDKVSGESEGRGGESEPNPGPGVDQMVSFFL